MTAEIESTVAKITAMDLDVLRKVWRAFRWEDEMFPGLSAAATAIAGSRWNGPRFFGLRDS